MKHMIQEVNEKIKIHEDELHRWNELKKSLQAVCNHHWIDVTCPWEDARRFLCTKCETPKSDERHAKATDN